MDNFCKKGEERMNYIIKSVLVTCLTFSLIGFGVSLNNNGDWLLGHILAICGIMIIYILCLKQFAKRGNSAK